MIPEPKPIRTETTTALEGAVVAGECAPTQCATCGAVLFDEAEITGVFYRFADEPTLQIQYPTKHRQLPELSHLFCWNMSSVTVERHHRPRRGLNILGQMAIRMRISTRN